MKLDLIRKEFTDHSTIGNLLIDNEFFCFTLEDAVREIKIPGQTAIPYGSYNVITNYSNRFKRIMPLIESVPGFDGVRIHTGNTDKNTEGCILIGYRKGVDKISESKLAFTAFMQRLTKGLKDGKVKIEIRT